MTIDSHVPKLGGPTPQAGLTLNTGGVQTLVAAALAMLALAGFAAFAMRGDQAQAVSRAGVDPLALQRVPERMWGVCEQNPQATQTPTLDVLVWDMVEIDDTMFVGGAFLSVCEDGDATPIPRPYLAAFDVATGDWDSSFAPNLDGAVYSLEVSPLGGLLVGGEFTSVNGEAESAGLVAIDPNTGQVDDRFDAWVDRPWSDLRATVRDMEVVGTDLYIGGNFSHVDGPGNSRSRKYKAARLDARWGSIDSTYTPQVTGSGVWGLEVDPTRSQVHHVGFFSAINGHPDSEAYHTVDAVTGASIDLPNRPRNLARSQPEMFDVSMGGDKVWISGEQHTVQILDPDTHGLVGWHGMGFLPCANDGFSYCSGFSGGAYQVAEQIGDVVYAGCHCTRSIRNGQAAHYSSFSQQYSEHKLIMAYDANTGELIEEFDPDINAERDGAWAVSSDSRGCLWVGGDFHVGGIQENRNRWLGGFARLCPPADAESPTQPVDVSAEDGIDGTITVSWSAAADNVGVHRYAIRRDGVADFAVVDGAQLSWVDTDVEPGDTHRYRIRAIDFAGNHSGDTDPPAQATVAGADETPPSVPAGLSASDEGGGSVILSWAASTDASGIRSYLVYRNGAYIGWTPAGTTSLTDTGLANGAPLTYTVRASDTAGNRSDRSAAATVTPGGADVGAPTVPADVVAMDVGNGEVTLSWTASEDDNGIKSYLIFRNGAYAGWTPGDETTWTDQDRADGVPLGYTVRAVDVADNRSERSAEATVSPGGADVTPPSVPSGVTADAAGAGSASLSWNPSNDDSGLKSYLIYRNGSYRGWTSGDTTTFSDEGLAPGVTFDYAVRAVDVADNRSDKSQVVTITP